VVPAQWLSNSGAASERVGGVLASALNTMSQPSHARRLRQVLTVLFIIWAALALGRLMWALVPTSEPVTESTPMVINPLASGNARAGAEPVDIDRMAAWHLFGKPGAAGPVTPEPAAVVQDNSRAGIEKGARETRLQLKLRGIVASTEDGLGHAIIETKKKQVVYAVGDKLPVSGKVVLAKVMPRQVVLDNGGTYELLVLFEDSAVGKVTASRPASTARPEPAANTEKRADEKTTSLARSYRERLYQNPQSLAEVVNVSAVREGGTLLGYRVNPGKDQAQFTQLGFKPGDMVISVNGVSLDEPANTMILYNSMRTAQEAVFELQREDQQLTLSVNLDSGATE
jgi:general secretion pathway protein C